LKKFILIILLFVCFINSGYSQLGSYAGAFSRMGFTARGISMGNAVVSDAFGDINGFYNPALATFQEEGLVNLGYTFLSLDRKLNFVGFTKKIKLPQQEQGGAGITVAWINSGVTDIDGRDNDTKQIGTYTTFENEFYLGTAFIIDKKISVGVGFKLYYAKLFTDVTATSFALDLGGIYKANDNLAFGLAYKDIGAKYEWQTSDLYGSLGNTTTDKFPKLLELGATYQLPKNFGIGTIALQQFFNPDLLPDTNGVTPPGSNNTVLRFGLEVNIVSQVKFKAGLDRIDFSTDDFTGNLEPTFGLGLNKNLSKNINLGIDYSFQLEPFTHDPIQNIGIVFKFK
jgi:hypothetical protein